MLMEPGQIENTPSTLKVPEHTLVKISPAREAARDFLGVDSMTLAEMISTINLRAKGLMQLERAFDLELSFLNDSAEALLRAKVNHMILECLPSSDEHRTLAQATGAKGHAAQWRHTLGKSLSAHCFKFLGSLASPASVLCRCIACSREGASAFDYLSVVAGVGVRVTPLLWARCLCCFRRISGHM